MNRTVQTVEVGDMKEERGEQRPCAVCKKPGERKPIEGLPGDGVLWRVIHQDGRTCEWAEYGSFEDLRESREESIQMACPVCGKKGEIQSYRKDSKAHPDIYEYKLRHGSHYCEIITQKQRRLVLKELGRYLFLCPVCKKVGNPGYYRTSNRFLVRHSKQPRHYMHELEHKELIAEECNLPLWLCSKPMGHNYLDN